MAPHGGSPTASTSVEPLVVDAHTHIFPPEIVQGREQFLLRDLWFGELYANPKANLINADDLIVSMTEAGVVQSVICGFPWRDLGLCREHNDYMAEACAASNGRLVWLGIVSPHVTDAAGEADRCLRLGALGLGEFNADAQGFDLTDRAALADVMEVAVAHDRPILLHSSEPAGHHYPGKGTATPDRLISFLTTFPALRVALAHWGGGLPFYELMPEVAAATARAAYDSAATTYLYRPHVFRVVTDLVGAGRVMFASDFPVLRQNRLLRQVRSLPWRDEGEMRDVLERTARAFYRIPLPTGADV
ncbi:MAG: amidohydrolase family protein [Thermomicrobiales bacterium]